MRALLLIVLALLASPLVAQQRRFEAGVRYLAMIPLDRPEYSDGRLELQQGMGFGVSAERFWSERISTHLSADFAQPEAFLYPASRGEEIDLVTLGINPVALTVRYHVWPGSRISPFVGGGGAIVFLGDLDDRFGEAIHADFEPVWAPSAEAGFRYRVRPRVTLDFTAAFTPVSANLTVVRTNTPLPARLEINPLVVSAGANWRF